MSLEQEKTKRRTRWSSWWSAGTGNGLKSSFSLSASALRGAILLLVFTGGWALFSPALVKVQTIPVLVVLLMASGTVYLYLAVQTKNQRWYAGVGSIFFLGLMMRLLVIPSIPLHEVDYHRYLWDGAVSAHGLNPFAYSPEQVSRAEGAFSEEYLRLRAEGGDILEKINHPRLTSIYPPLTQFFFAIAHWLQPWSLSAWRAVLLLMDMLTFLLLILLLMELGQPAGWVLIYWWNPLLIKEVYNSAHMEVLLFPFLLLAILFSLKHRPRAGLFFLVLAGAVKIWPLFLLPLFLRPILNRPSRWLAGLGMVVVLSLLFLWPLLAQATQPQAGILNYVRRWEMNDALFSSLVAGWEAILPSWQIHPGYAQLFARRTVAVVLFLLACGMGVLPLQSKKDFCRKILWFTAALYFLSPTQFPWYALWMWPLLAVVPSTPLLLLSVTLPLYYLHFYMQELGAEVWFDQGIVWLEFVPIWILLLLQVWKKGSTPSLLTKKIPLWHAK